jgi:hypothetical protein
VTTTLLRAASLLADEVPRDSGPDFGKASPFGLVIVVILLICTFCLVWSMNRHLKKLPDSFDREHPEPDQAVDDGTVVLPGKASEATGETHDAGSDNPMTDGNPRREPGS